MQLNKEQKIAVDTIEGPVMVIAGPGTGKTQVLTLRIANIIRKTDVGPEAILALTFTEAGVAAMRKRLAEILQPASFAYDVAIETFHSFANGIIRKYPEEFSRIIGADPMTDIDQYRVIESAIDSIADLHYLRPFGDPYNYVSKIIHTIAELKKEAIAPDEYVVMAKKAKDDFLVRTDLYHEKGAHKGKMRGECQEELKSIEKNIDISKIYAFYQNALAKEKHYDYDDMIMEVSRVMRENENFRLILQEQYQYVLVDEHQDTNQAQNRILESLMSYHDNPNLFMVGDPKQAIYRFQGASLENFNYFKNKYPAAKLITLSSNYRSTQSILDAARAGLQARAGHAEKPILLCTMSTPDAEHYFVAWHIQQRLKAKTPAEQIAILYRRNSDAFNFARMLGLHNIEYTIESDMDILADPDVKAVVLILEAIQHFGEDAYLAPLLYLKYFGIDPLEAHRIIAEAKRNGGLYDRISRELKSLYGLLKYWHEVAHNGGLLDVFDSIIDKTGILKRIVTRTDAGQALEKLGQFMDEIKKVIASDSEAKLEDLIAHINRVREHGLMIRGASNSAQTGKVRLMTAHRAKGLEFDYVYIVDATATKWIARKAEQEPDERNLFYVALTRARKELVISYSQLNQDKREQLPAPYIADIKPELLKNYDANLIEREFEKKRAIVFALPREQLPDIANREFVRDLFYKHGFAVTHLNNYLKCPWQYFFVNLLRIPQIPQQSQMYGIAAHGALKDLFDARARHGGRALRDGLHLLLKSFERHLNEQPFSKDRIADALKKGKRALEMYWDQYAHTWKYKTLAEFKISIPRGKMLLTGSIDKIELLSGSTTKYDINVVDYKTGKQKSRNVIEGKTKDSDGSYKRQLVFYNLLLNNYKNGLYRMKTATIDFIEPNERGKFRQEQFVISASEIRDLEKLIDVTADEIVNMKFWNKTCGDKDCKWCDLRAEMNS